MVSHLFHDPRWTGKSGRETYSKKNWRRTNWKTCPTLNRLLPPAFDISNDKIEMLWQQEFTRGRDDEPVAKLKSKATTITYPKIWFLELPPAIFLRPLLWLTPATLNLNTYSEGRMGLWCWKVAFAVNLHCLCSWWPGFLAAVPFLKGAFNKQWHRTFAVFAIFDMPQVFTFTIIRW